MHKHPHAHHHPHPPQPRVATQTPVFTKVFRWEQPNPEAEPPNSVEIVASFSEWQPFPLVEDTTGKLWHLTIEGIPGNCTHRYMLLVDGQPVNDPHADGLAIPETDAEKAIALKTARGPRIFMLFAQMK